MIDHDNKFIQVKINKCASTTIQHSLNRNISNWVPHYHLLDQINTIEKDVLQDSKKYFKFTFVRNPWID